jgi:hypothetical protein
MLFRIRRCYPKHDNAERTLGCCSTRGGQGGPQWTSTCSGDAKRAQRAGRVLTGRPRGQGWGSAAGACGERGGVTLGPGVIYSVRSGTLYQVVKEEA